MLVMAAAVSWYYVTLASVTYTNLLADSNHSQKKIESNP